MPESPRGMLDAAEALLALCRFEEAEAQARQAKEILVSLQSSMLPRALSIWGIALRQLGRYEEAAPPLLEAIRLTEQDLGSEHPILAIHLNQYGVLCKYMGRYEEGEAAYRGALGVAKDSLQIATIYHNLGGIEHARGDYAKGEPLARRAYEMRRELLGEDDPATQADAVAWAGLLDGLGRQSQSIPSYRKALGIFEARLGPEHFEIAATLNNLGMALLAQGQIEEGRAALVRSLAIKRGLFDESHPEVALTLENLRSASARPML